MPDFDSYTAAPRQIVNQAIGIARSRGHDELTPAHLLLAILTDSQASAGEASRRAIANLEELRAAVEARLRAAPKAGPDRPPRLAAAAQAILEGGVEAEAQAIDRMRAADGSVHGPQGVVGLRELVRAVLRDEPEVAAIVREAGLDPQATGEALCDEVLRVARLTVPYLVEERRLTTEAGELWAVEYLVMRAGGRHVRVEARCTEEGARAVAERGSEEMKEVLGERCRSRALAAAAASASDVRLWFDPGSAGIVANLTPQPPVEIASLRPGS
jgi:hypothetical protein